MSFFDPFFGGVLYFGALFSPWLYEVDWSSIALALASQVWRFMKSWLECCAGQERVPEAPA
jgi:hypothetical protein